MKKIIKIIILTFIFLSIICFFHTVQAAGFVSTSSNKSICTVDDEFIININISEMSTSTFTAKLNIDTSKVEYISGPQNSNFVNGRIIYTWTDPSGGENPKTSGNIASFRFRAKKSGTASFGVSGDFYDSDENDINPSFSGTSVEIEEKQIETPPSNNEEPAGNNIGEVGSENQGGSGVEHAVENTNNQNEGNSEVNNQNFSNNENQNTNVNNNQNYNNENNISSQVEQNTENISQNYYNNQVEQNNNEQNVTSVSQNVNLSGLHLNVEGISPSFNKDILEYYIVVSDKINDIEVDAKPENDTANIEIIGNKNLKLGSNKIEIVVTSGDNKTSKTYVINVSKTDDKNLGNANLENLAIENVELVPEFASDILNYSIEVGSDIDSVNILAVPQNEKANVQIFGNENLRSGDNLIEINVTAEDGITIKKYNILVHKKDKEEEKVENESKEIVLNKKEAEINNKEKNNFWIIVAVIIIIILSIIGIVGYYIYKKRT